MRRWIGGLHGGQLLMVLAGLTGVGFACVWIGVYVYMEPSNAAMRLADDLRYGSPLRSVVKDSAQSLAVEMAARKQGGVGLYWAALGLLAWLLSIPSLWWWFDARRRVNRVA